MLTIFKTLIRGSIEYGSFLLPTQNSKLMDSLESAQGRALRLCIGFRRSTPTNVVHAESGIGPVRHRFMFLTSKFLLKSFSLKDSILIDKLYDLQVALFVNNRSHSFNKFLLYNIFCTVKKYKHKIAFFSNIPLYLFSFETSTFCPNTEFTPPMVVEEIRGSRFPQLTFQSALSHLTMGRHQIFTDASRYDGSDFIGIGLFSPSLQINKMFKIDRDFSIFSGECIAIILAVECVLEIGVSKATIFTDSRSVVDMSYPPTGYFCIEKQIEVCISTGYR